MVDTGRIMGAMNIRNKAFAHYVRGVGSTREAAEELNLALISVESIRRGVRPCNIHLAKKIEDLTREKVKRLHLLYPAEFNHLYPEPGDS